MGRKAYRVRPKMKIENKDEVKTDDASRLKEIKLTKSFSREIKFSIVSIFIVCILTITGSYSIFTAINKSNDYNTITVGTLKVDFLQDTANVINLNGAYPTMDSEGLKLEPYTFKLSNTGSLNAAYKIKIVNDDEIIAEDGCQNNLLQTSFIKVSINGEEPFILEDKAGTDYVVVEGVASPSQISEYNIRIWIADTAGNESLGRHYHGKIVVDSVNLNT